jgi:hypothetical protein
MEFDKISAPIVRGSQVFMSCWHEKKQDGRVKVVPIMMFNYTHVRRPFNYTKCVLRLFVSRKK